MTEDDNRLIEAYERGFSAGYRLAKEERISGVYGLSVEDIGLSLRSRNCLLSAGLNTLGKVASSTASSLMDIRGFGETALYEVREKLQDYGLFLASEPPT